MNETETDWMEVLWNKRIETKIFLPKNDLNALWTFCMWRHSSRKKQKRNVPLITSYLIIVIRRRLWLGHFWTANKWVI